MYVYTWGTGCYFRKLAHVIAEAGKFEIRREAVGWSFREKLMLSLESEGYLEAEFLFPSGASVFPLEAFNWWMRSTHHMESNQLYSVYGFKCESHTLSPARAWVAQVA